MAVIGLISDTHNLLREAALRALAGTTLIIHAGDVGNPEVLERLALVAPVTAVRGNVDKGAWASALSETAAVEVDGAWIYVLHDLNQIDINPGSAGFAAVVSGHSHRPGYTEKDGVLYVNPGSAGPRRFRLPITVARMNVRARSVEFLELER